MKYSFRFLCSIVVAGMLFLCGSAIAQDKPTDKISTGETLFKANCVLCHGSDGRAKTPLGQQLKAHDLHSEEVQKRTNAELKNIILHGQKSMPPFEGQLSSEKVDQILSFVREFGKKKK